MWLYNNVGGGGLHRETTMRLWRWHCGVASSLILLASLQALIRCTSNSTSYANFSYLLGSIDVVKSFHSLWSLCQNAEAMEGMLAMGFGFVEVGSVCLNPQPGIPLSGFSTLPSDSLLLLCSHSIYLTLLTQQVIPSRACFGCPKKRPSSIAMASTVMASCLCSSALNSLGKSKLHKRHRHGLPYLSFQSPVLWAVSSEQWAVGRERREERERERERTYNLINCLPYTYVLSLNFSFSYGQYNDSQIAGSPQNENRR